MLRKGNTQQQAQAALIEKLSYYVAFKIINCDVRAKLLFLTRLSHIEPMFLLHQTIFLRKDILFHRIKSNFRLFQALRTIAVKTPKSRPQAPTAAKT